MKRIILFFTFIVLASNLLAARDYPKWLESAAIYHIYPSSYMDSDGNGYGDLEGIQRGICLFWIGFMVFG